ncbi:unnamed protein product [Rhizoctonia solani]|uniref:Uncharacterized protein n=1 Tax=Rhizoctonia solani TaxID=456999 RepID=A0A8H3C8E3_9AGAM|nr:unnamed protein product [Rhizoctonia solani]
MHTSDLVPYDVSMQPGQGYNSFLHRPCIYNAVEMGPEVKLLTTRATSERGISQVVSYSSRIVNRASEVTRSLNVSAAASVKNGGIRTAGHQSGLDDTKIATSDINLVISVKVTNETTTLGTHPKIFEIPGLQDTVENSEARFHQVYGDSYISGFVVGGEFHATMSIKVLDRSQKNEIISDLTRKLGKTKDKSLQETTNRLRDTFNDSMKQAETSISVHWRGGGKIKADDEQWTIESLFTAAAAFPNKVAKSPQRCWAILTRYPNNPSFMKSSFKSIPVHDYSNVQQYAADLFDAFVQYKSCLLRIKDALDLPLDYISGPGIEPIEMRVEALISARGEIKKEMFKIISAVEDIDLSPANVKTILEGKDFGDPEIWATRLPVLNDAMEAIPEASVGNTQILAPPELVLDALMMMSFVGEDGKEHGDENLIHEIAQQLGVAPLEPSESETVGHLATSETREAMNDKEREIVETPENRRRFAPHFRFDVPYGSVSGSSKAFNDAEQLAKAIVAPGWPVRLQVQMVKDANGEPTLGMCRAIYPHIKLHTDDVMRNTLGDIGRINIGLGASDRITCLKFGLDKKQEVVRIRSVEVQTSGGQHKKVPGSELAKESDDHVTCHIPDGFSGLKGFYGYKAQGKVERIGVIWGK